MPSINIETRLKNAITNFQSWAITHNAYANSLYRQKHPKAVVRAFAVSMYNCHGLTFGARRCEILDSIEVKKIIDDDAYKRISAEKALPGDMVMYFDKDGDFEHSGLLASKVVIEKVPLISLLVNTYSNPVFKEIYHADVVSKWGSGGDEMLHEIKDCPYTLDFIQFFRMTDNAIP